MNYALALSLMVLWFWVYEEKVLYIIQIFLFFPVNIISWKNKIYVFVFLCVEILMTNFFFFFFAYVWFEIIGPERTIFI